MEDSRERTYQTVVNCVRDNNLTMLQFKINKLKSIIDYRDSAALLEECYKKVKKVKRRMAAKKVLSVIALVFDILMVTFIVCLCIILLKRA